MTDLQCMLTLCIVCTVFGFEIIQQSVSMPTILSLMQTLWILCIKINDIDEIIWQKNSGSFIDTE